jgi:hypothetical protein
MNNGNPGGNVFGGGGPPLTNPSQDFCSENDGHCYQTTHVICPAQFECTPEEIQYYATLFQYPGQNPLFPVQSGQTYFVFPAPQLATFFGNPALNWTGAIQTIIAPGGLTLTNQSMPTHIFHDGYVVRSYEQQEDGAWTVTTTGGGTNVWPVIGPAIDQVNDAVGPLAFPSVSIIVRQASAII